MERKREKAKNKKEESSDYENFEQEAIAKLRAGKGLTGPDGDLTVNRNDTAYSSSCLRWGDE